MSSNNISLDPDQAAISVNKLIDGQEAAGYVGDRVASYGVGAGYAYTFKNSLDNYVSDIKLEMGKLKTELADLQERVTQRVLELSDQDESLAGDTAQFGANVVAANISHLSSGSYTPAPSPTPTTPLTWS